jgi:hypothetical protein
VVGPEFIDSLLIAEPPRWAGAGGITAGARYGAARLLGLRAFRDSPMGLRRGPTRTSGPTYGAVFLNVEPPAVIQSVARHILLGHDVRPLFRSQNDSQCSLSKSTVQSRSIRPSGLIRAAQIARLSKRSPFGNVPVS